MYEHLPQELKDYPFFCGWKYEIVKGNRTKVSKSVKGHNADTRDLNEFAPLDEVMKHLDKYDGIGIALAGGIAAIDIGHCIYDGKLSPRAEDIIAKANSYTEISPSGEGIRILAKADGFVFDTDKYYILNHALGLEAYAARDKGYVTVTGNVIHNKPVRDITDVLPEILEKYMQRPMPRSMESSVDTPGSFLTDDKAVDKASRSVNGDKFIALYDGDISGYPSQSEAELAFMTMLAFWCGGDEEQMERVYLGSGLKREKWNRADYRNSAISKALRGVTVFYKPVPTTSAADDVPMSQFRTTLI